MPARWIGIVAVAILSLPARAAGDSPPKKELAELQGVWKLVGREQGGKETDLTAQPRWVIRGDKVFYGGEELAALTIDAGTTPRCIDLTFAAPNRTYEGIYSVEGGKLRICYNRETEGTKSRPTVLSTKDQADARMLVFQREDNKEKDNYDGIAGFVGLIIGENKDKGEVVVLDALPGGGAQMAGLQSGDSLVSIDNAKAESVPGVVQKLRQCKPGSEVAFTIKRSGSMKEIKVKVGIVPFQMD
jgi:uncharacterized protein (TIGR03067 family)